MPPFQPYTYRVDQTGLYNPAQEERATGPRWTAGSQTVPHPLSETVWGATKLGLGIGALALIGKQQFGQGKRGWDYILHGVRAVEEYSPGRIFRTFQVSHMLSALETPSLQKRFFSPEILHGMRSGGIKSAGYQWLEHLSRTAGRDLGAMDIASQGFRYEKGQLLLGETGQEVLLKHARVMRAPSGTGTRLQEGMARSLKGGPLLEHLKDPVLREPEEAAKIFSQRVPYLDRKGRLTSEAFSIFGGQTRTQAAGRFIAGYGTTLAERINQLARAPFELPVISDILAKVPVVKNLRLGVVPSSGLKTVGKITAKLGILGTAGLLAYRHLDYAARESEALDNTVLSEGISAGVGTIWTRSQLATSQAADWLGLHMYREKQEEIAPGSTELSKLMAFPILGAFAGLTGGYAARLGKQFRYRRLGLDLTQASLATNAEDAFFRSKVYGTEIDQRILGGLDKRTVDLVQESTEKKLGRLSGRFIAKTAEIGKRRTGAGALMRTFGKLTPGRLGWLGGAMAGAAAVLPFVPGALVPSDRPEELEKIYSGEQKIAVRKGRWWEFGRTPFEGTRIDRFREHWYPRMLARAKEKAIWGEDAPSPLERWYKENLTYELEQKHYKERPYPITGTAFEDIPFVGPILAATVGQLVKPAAIMHPEAWIKTSGADGGGQRFLAPHLKYGQEVLPGEAEIGAPVSPYDFKGTVGEQVYRMTEMVGLPGFTMTQIKEGITGTQDVFDQEMQLESARRMYGAERDLWDLDLGGGLGTTELLRRLYPHRRRQIELYNPIRNAMPEWLPGADERSPDFLHGDPFTKVPEGEMRLPGPGYAALNPEMRGVAPEDYSAFHRFRILADVAPYTNKYKQSLRDVRAAIKNKELSSKELDTYRETLKQVAARKVRRTFTPYKYRDRAMTEWETALAARNEELKQGSDEPSWFAKTVGGYWETLAHGAETPFEFLTPISPAAKLIHMRTAVEDYERTQVFGTENAFWGHPIRDFFGPAYDAAKNALGYKGIPSQVQEKRDLEEYFDILKYVKYTRLKRAAQVADDEGAAKDFENKRRETLFGINPYTYNYSHIFRSLPRRDRDYFNAFIEADTEERERILELIPENEKALMLARWELTDAADIKKATKAGLLSDGQLERAKAQVREMYEKKETEGMPKTEKLWTEYLSTRLEQESYPDWYRRVKLLEEELEGKPLPGADWVGWHPAVDLQDIKLKVVENMGKNMYDYDLWQDRARAVARRPFIADAAEEIEDSPDYETLRERITDVLSAHDIDVSHVTLVASQPGSSVVNMDLEHDRSEDMREMIRRGV